MQALIYLRLQHGPYIEQDDLDRLDKLRQYARTINSVIAQVWPVHQPDGAAEPPGDWYDARADLADGRFDVIILWHEDLGAPTAILPEDLTAQETTP